MGSWCRAAGLGLKLADRIPVTSVLHGWRELSDAEYHPAIQIHPRQNEIAHLKVTEVHRPGDPEASRGPPTLIVPDSHLPILRLDPLHQSIHPDEIRMVGESDRCREEYRGTGHDEGSGKDGPLSSVPRSHDKSSPFSVGWAGHPIAYLLSFRLSPSDEATPGAFEAI